MSGINISGVQAGSNFANNFDLLKSHHSPYLLKVFLFKQSLRVRIVICLVCNRTCILIAEQIFF